jgi:Flp pilus assembly protein TadG
MRIAGRLSRRSPRGAAAVEFAIVLPLLLLVLLGTIDWGYYFFCREVVVNASREGARAGSLVPAGTSPVANAEAAALAYLEGGSLDPVLGVVSAEETADSVIVEVQYTTGSLTGFLTGVMPKTVNARAEMRR